MHFTFFGRDSRRPQRRLTRQRKLRHLTEIDIGGFPSGNHQSRPSASPSASPVPLWFKIGRDCYSLPVPSPELLQLLERRASGSSSSSSSSNSGCFPLPSPKEAAAGGDVESADGPDSSNGDGMVGSKLACQTASKCAEHVNKSLAGLSLNYGKKALQGQNHIENTRHNLWLSIPAKSAPSSGFLSPEDSPRRLSSVDSLPSAQMISPELQFWSAHKLPASDMPHSAQSSPEKFVASASHSPLHSPVGTSPSPNSNTQNRAASALHLKMPSDGSISWLDSKRVIAVHPLPLPPGGAGPLPQSASFHQAAVRQDVLPMSSQWQKGRLIGSGTFGSVYIATNRETGALCAVKEVNLVPDDPKSAECTKQLEQEIKVLSQLKHQNIVQYYGSEIVDDHFYIYLEYVHPGSISKYVRDHCGAMTESVVRNFTRHILSGLAYLHSAKIIHRDIKGGNLLVDAAGVVKLADFGMAKHLTGKAAELSLKGSPYWMAPEVMQAMMNKDAEYDLAVDIWSLGCTIIEMFTGKPPWIELEWAAAMFKVLRNETPPIPETLSAEGKNFLQCCFQRDPADRPSASMLLEHPFVKNSQHQEIPSCVQATSQLKSVDVQSPRDQMNLMQTSPGTMARKGKQSLNGESGQSHPKSSKSVLASRHSPRSTLEAIPCLSPPRTNQKIPSSSPSPHVLKGIHLGTWNHRSFPLPKLREKCHIFSDAP